MTKGEAYQTKALLRANSFEAAIYEPPNLPRLVAGEPDYPESTPGYVVAAFLAGKARQLNVVEEGPALIAEFAAYMEPPE